MEQKMTEITPEELLDRLKYDITTDKNSTTYRCNRVIHRDNDQPAVIRANGTKFWYQHGNLHRDNDQPAVIYADGYKAWYINGNRVSNEK